MLAALGIALLVYVPFALFLTSQFSTWWPLLALMGAFAAKFVELLFTPTEVHLLISRQGTLSVLGSALWLVLLFITALLPQLPNLGLSDNVLRGVALSGFGAWEDEPKRLCAYGLLYFAASAVLRVRLSINLFADLSRGA